jgi:hypothetical protein
MWWKLTLVGLVTIILVAFALPPIQTHAVLYHPEREPSPQTWSVGGFFKALQWTPTSMALVAAIVLGAVCAGYLIVRSSR